MTPQPTPPDTPALPWRQLSLLSEEVVEIFLRIGVVPETDHLQWQITARAPTDGGLLGMLSSPAVSAQTWPRQLMMMSRALDETYRNHVGPF